MLLVTGATSCSLAIPKSRGGNLVAISYVGGKGAGTAGQGGGSITLTTGLTGGSGGAPLEDDLVIVTVSVGTAARQPNLAIATPAGYTALPAQRTTSTSVDANVQTSYKVMGASPDTAVTIPASGNAADGISYAIEVFRGVDPVTPMDVTPTHATGTGTSVPNPASITPVSSGAWIVVCGGGAAAAGAVFTAAYLTNFLTFNGADTQDGTVGCGYLTWPGGTYDPAAFGGGNVNAANGWGATTIALRPAVELSQISGSADMSFGAGSSSMGGAGALSGTSSVTCGGTAVVTGAGAVQGAAALAFGGSGLIGGSVACVGSSNLSFTNSADAEGAAANALEGAAVVVLGGSGTTLASGDLTGSSPISVSSQASMGASGALSGASPIIVTGAGAVEGFASIAGVVPVTLTPQGTVSAVGPLAGVGTFAFLAQAAGEATYALVGPASMTLTPQGVMVGAGHVQGTSSLSLGLTGTPQGDAPVLTGLASLSVTSQGVLLADGALAGPSVLSLIAQAALVDTGPPSEELSGAVSMSFSLTGWLLSLHEKFPLADISQDRPLDAATPTRPLAGQTVQYPLAGINREFP